VAAGGVAADGWVAVGGGEEEQNGEDEQGRHRGVECGLEEETG
jgi:hypothetical protein